VIQRERQAAATSTATSTTTTAAATSGGITAPAAGGDGKTQKGNNMVTDAQSRQYHGTPQRNTNPGRRAGSARADSTFKLPFPPEPIPITTHM
jgi:hypothetical protein